MKTRLLLSILVVFVTAGAGFGQREPQRPYRGSIPWAVLLCQFKGDPAPAHAPSYFKNLFTVGNDGLADWLRLPADQIGLLTCLALPKGSTMLPPPDSSTM